MKLRNHCLVTFFNLFFILITNSLQAQHDFAVMHKGDTLRGEIKILSYEMMDKIQVATKEKKTIYTALQIKTLQKGEVSYEPIRYDNTIRFMKVLKSGYLSFYAFNPSNQLTWDGRYLYKKDGNGVELPNLTFKKTLSNFLSDCPNIRDRINAGEFSKREIEKIIDLYNECLQSKTEALNILPVRTDSQNTSIVKAIDNLTAKIEGENFLTKKDALDMLKDIRTKVSKNEAVPHYLVEGLKSYLLDTPSLSGDLDKVISLLKK
ncbi:MAG: hypothetical protein JSS79_14430 [Bacteroidetes bacterium]|nr:hypothetical protein [Bacteroidota bacterium]